MGARPGAYCRNSVSTPRVCRLEFEEFLSAAKAAGGIRSVLPSFRENRKKCETSRFHSTALSHCSELAARVSTHDDVILS